MDEKDALEVIKTAQAAGWNLNYEEVTDETAKCIYLMEWAMTLAEDEIKDARSRLRWIKATVEDYNIVDTA